MTAPMHAAQVIKVVSIDDLGVNIVQLPYGVFLIDGEVVTNTGYNSQNKNHEIAAKDLENIRAVNTKTVITHYESVTGETISVEDYLDQHDAFLSKIEFDEDRYEHVWNDLDDEFAYRKFEQKWKAEYKTETSYSEPLLIDRTHILQDTGNPYIKAGFLTGKADTPLYNYSRTNAVASLLAKKFESLGMEFKEGITYSATEGKKVWGNSNHSHLEYVTAFGKYIINKAALPKTRGEFKGSLEHLTKIYEEDKKWIEELIQIGYNLHFRNEGASTVLLNDVHNGLKNAITYVNTLDVKQKSETSKRSALNKLNELLNLVNQEVLRDK